MFTITIERQNLRRCQKSQCARPRKLVLRRRKIRRKLLQDEKERLGQRRRFLSGKPEEDSVDSEDDRVTVNEINQTPRKDDQIERNPENKKQAFDNALERLKSLVRERNSR